MCVGQRSEYDKLTKKKHVRIDKNTNRIKNIYYIETDIKLKRA